ncbi:MAG: DUF423 domain-containing protein [Chloroflexota bacterium]
MNRIFLTAAAIFGFLAVGLGAFGTHALAAHFDANPQREPTYETAVQYQMFHVVGLVVIAWLDRQQNTRLTKAAGWLFAAGIMLFCGSLYILAVFQISAMGAVAPLGGLAFLSGWALTGISAYRLR